MLIYALRLATLISAIAGAVVFVGRIGAFGIRCTCGRINIDTACVVAAHATTIFLTQAALAVGSLLFRAAALLAHLARLADVVAACGGVIGFIAVIGVNGPFFFAAAVAYWLTSVHTTP